MIAWRWLPREPPLVPVWALAEGEGAAALVSRFVGRGGVSVVVAPGVCAVRAPRLPWVDGVTYLGRDPACPGAWWPTAERPSVPPALLLGAALQQELAGPVLLWRGGVLSAASAAPLSHEVAELAGFA